MNRHIHTETRRCTRHKKKEKKSDAMMRFVIIGICTPHRNTEPQSHRDTVTHIPGLLGSGLPLPCTEALLPVCPATEVSLMGLVQEDSLYRHMLILSGVNGQRLFGLSPTSRRGKNLKMSHCFRKEILSCLLMSSIFTKVQ